MADIFGAYPVLASDADLVRVHQQRNKARLTAARHAKDADDLRVLLDVLALWPQQDDPGIVGPSLVMLGARYDSRTKRDRNRSGTD